MVFITKPSLSAEETGGTFVCYADVGLEDEDGEPMEAIELARWRSCDTLHALRAQCERCRWYDCRTTK
jgi:hypothetical protein